MKKKIVWLAVLSSLVFGETTLQFGDESNVNENEYGERTSEASVTVNTENFQIDRFWHKFKKGAGNDALDVQMNTTIDFNLITRSSFLCKKFGLEKEGCSGQKPLLINDGTINDDPNNVLKFDKDGNPLPTEEYRIPFDSAENYSADHKDAFYALDIYRDMQYYLPVSDVSEDSNSPKNFFGKLILFFKDYFSHDVTVYGSDLDDPKSRQRYIANLTFGAQQNYRMKKGETSFSTTYNSADPGTVSLLDYSENLSTNESGCSGLVFDFDPQSFTCKIVNFFSMSQWMPFVDSTDVTSVETKSVLEDTETTLLTLAGSNDGTSYVTPKLSEPNGKKGFFGQMFKPMNYMMDSMFRFFFGNSSKNLTEMFALDFNFSNPIALTFATTNGNVITGFEHFKLLGLESVYGTEAEECTVKLKDYDKLLDFFKSFFSWLPFFKSTHIEARVVDGTGSSTWYSGNTKTFKKGSTKKVDFYKVTSGWFSYDEELIKTVTSDEWVGWCKRNQGVTKKSLFGRMTDSVSSFVDDIVNGNDNPNYSDDEETLDNFLNCGNSWENLKNTLSKDNQDICFKVDTYKEKVHKGLILHLKHINVDQITIGTPGTHTEYSIKQVHRNGTTNSKPNMNHNENGGMH